MQGHWERAPAYVALCMLKVAGGKVDCATRPSCVFASFVDDRSGWKEGVCQPLTPAER